MISNVYELSKEEKDKHLIEFNNTEFARKLLKYKKESKAVMILCIVLIVAIVVLADIISGDYQDLSGLPTIAFWVALIEYIACTISLKVAFYRWLKIKYNIEY